MIQLSTLNPLAYWWVKIHTETPKCTYYFGPFRDASEAQSCQDGYVQDLTQEGAQGITVATQLGSPQELTVLGKEN